MVGSDLILVLKKPHVSNGRLHNLYMVLLFLFLFVFAFAHQEMVSSKVRGPKVHVRETDLEGSLPRLDPKELATKKGRSPPQIWGYSIILGLEPIFQLDTLEGNQVSRVRSRPPATAEGRPQGSAQERPCIPCQVLKPRDQSLGTPKTLKQRGSSNLKACNLQLDKLENWFEMLGP